MCKASAGGKRSDAVSEGGQIRGLVRVGKFGERLAAAHCRLLARPVDSQLVMVLVGVGHWSSPGAHQQPRQGPHRGEEILAVEELARLDVPRHRLAVHAPGYGRNALRNVVLEMPSRLVAQILEGDLDVGGSDFRLSV